MGPTGHILRQAAPLCDPLSARTDVSVFGLLFGDRRTVAPETPMAVWTYGRISATAQLGVRLRRYLKISSLGISIKRQKHTSHLPSSTRVHTANMKSSTNGTGESMKLGQQDWLALSQCMAPRETDLNFWWHLIGRQLAAFTEAAGYTKEKRYEILLTHYHWTVSRTMIGNEGVTNPSTSRCHTWAHLGAPISKRATGAFHPSIKGVPRLSTGGNGTRVPATQLESDGPLNPEAGSQTLNWIHSTTTLCVSYCMVWL